MNWKEQLNTDNIVIIHQAKDSVVKNVINAAWGFIRPEMIRFIETEIISKLIEEIPEELGCTNTKCGFCENEWSDGGEFKNKLRANWLGEGGDSNE